MTFRRILTFALSQIFLVMFLTVAGARAGTIYRQWHMQGYTGTATTGSFSGMSRISGQVRITETGFEFSGSVGSFTLSAPLTPSYDYSDLVKEEAEYKTNYINSTRAKITVVDDDTLLLSYGYAEFGKEYDEITFFRGYVAVLTAEPVPIQLTPPTRHPIMAGTYDVVRSWLDMSDASSGVTAGTERRGIKIVTMPGDIYQVFESNDPLLMERAPSFGIYKTKEYTTDRFIQTDGPMITEEGELIGYFYIWNLLEHEDFELLDLGDGRVLYSQMRALLVEIEHDFFNGGDYTIPSHVWYSELACALLKTKAIGRVQEVDGTEEEAGTAFVIREGVKLAITDGDFLYEGDELISEKETTIDVAFFEGSGMTVHQETRLKITKFSAKGTGTIELFKGWIENRVTGGSFYNLVKLFVRTPNAIVTVRPSGFPIEFAVDYTEAGIIAQTKLDVVKGQVEISNADGSVPQVVIPTMVRLLQTEVKLVMLRIQASPGSEVTFGGETITTFPHVIEVPVGTEVTLTANPPETLGFSHWWTRETHQSESITFTAGRDMELRPEANLSGNDAETILEEGLEAAGLDTDDAEPGATPFDDGNTNLVKWAFNMNLSGPDSRSLVFGGGSTAGLPAIDLKDNSGTKTAMYQYLRRTDGSLIYRPMVSSDLTTWEPLGAPETVETLGNGWEKVTHFVPLNVFSPSNLSFRVQVLVPGS